MEHHLKCWPQFFSHILSGRKTFEKRKSDRPYCVGDTLILHEWDPATSDYTGIVARRLVTYILNPSDAFGEEGWVIMALAPPVEASAAQRVPVKIRDGSFMDEQYAKALEIINEQREEIERLKAAKPSVPSPTLQGFLTHCPHTGPYVCRECSFNRDYQSPTPPTHGVASATINVAGLPPVGANTIVVGEKVSAAEPPGEARPHSSSPVTPGIPTQEQAWAEIRDTMVDNLLSMEQKKSFVLSILSGVLANPTALPETGIQEAEKNLLSMEDEDMGSDLREAFTEWKAALSKPAETGIVKRLFDIFRRLDRMHQHHDDEHPEGLLDSPRSLAKHTREAINDAFRTFQGPGERVK